MNKKRWLGLVGVIVVIVAIIVYQMVNQADDGSNANGENSQADESTSAVFESTLAEPTHKDVSVHDPSIIKVDDQYYVFGTHIEAAKSSDLMRWDRFTNGYTTPENVLYGDLSENLK